MSQNIRLKRSAVPGRVPTVDQVELGEIALNTYDGKIYLKQDNGSPTIIAVGETSSFAVSASFARSSSFATTASYVTVQSATASFALTASFVNPLRQNIQLTGSLFISSSTAALSVFGSGSGVFSVDGTSGRLFSVDDSLSGSLFSVNTAAGLPVIEAFSDNTIRMGQFGQKALFVSSSAVGIGKENPLNAALDVSGSAIVTGSITSTVGFTGSLQGSASYAISASNADTASYVVTAQTASYVITAQTASYVLNAVSSSYAATSSFANNFTVAGTLTAQTIVAQTITSSIDFVTGSTRFGSLLANTHSFTGSVGITG
jgi:hypothetical protein